MYTIRFIWIGKTKEEYLKTGMETYLNKLRHYVNIELLEIKPITTRHVGSVPQDLNQIRRKESENILSKIQQGSLPSHETTIVLDENGQKMSTIHFAKCLDDLKSSQHGRVNFVVGGAFGLDVSLFTQSKLLSFSSMTFTHQMIRLILLEQVYRAFTIINHEPYHH